MLNTFSEWLANSPASMVIQNTFWVVPAVQSVHILAIAIVMSSILMVDLRLLGVIGRSQPLSAVTGRFLPWVWWAVVVLLASGAILIVGEPGRELLSQVFWMKMSLLACVLLLTLVIQRGSAGGGVWERHRALAGLIAAVSLLLWIAILAAGRWIGYAGQG